jgi:hypothetical protein
MKHLAYLGTSGDEFLPCRLDVGGDQIEILD